MDLWRSLQSGSCRRFLLLCRFPLLHPPRLLLLASQCAAVARIGVAPALVLADARVEVAGEDVVEPERPERLFAPELPLLVLRRCRLGCGLVALAAADGSPCLVGLAVCRPASDGLLCGD
jgi:hypothetical protein